MFSSWSPNGPPYPAFRVSTSLDFFVFFIKDKLPKDPVSPAGGSSLTQFSLPRRCVSCSLSLSSLEFPLLVVLFILPVAFTSQHQQAQSSFLGSSGLPWRLEPLQDPGCLVPGIADGMKRWAEEEEVPQDTRFGEMFPPTHPHPTFGVAEGDLPHPLSRSDGAARVSPSLRPHRGPLLSLVSCGDGSLPSTAVNSRTPGWAPQSSLRR